MIPGSVSKVSEFNVSLAATIIQTADVMRVTSTAATTQFANVTPAFGLQQACIMVLQNKSGNSITALTTGNIAGSGSITILSLRQAIFVWSALEQKWSVTNDT